MWLYDYKDSEKNNPYKESPFVAITHMSYVDNLPKWSYPWHAHRDSYELGYIIDGEGTLTVESKELPLKAGSITMVPPNVMHRFVASPEQSMRYYTLRILAKPADGELQQFFHSLDNAVTEGFSYMDYIQSTFELLFNFHQMNQGVIDAAFQSACLSLLQLTKILFTDRSMSIRLDDTHSAIDILKYIEQNNSQKITLESLAKRFNVSPSHLSRIFTNAYHMSPINYLIYSRITYATEYLLKTNYSVAEIAELVGYDNPTHFTNLFVKRIGCTPTEFREHNKKLPTDLPEQIFRNENLNGN